MKRVPIVKSKLTIPRQAEPFIFSDRIKKLCKSIYEHDVVTVTAPAGYGKTSLLLAVSSLNGKNSGKVFWYRMDYHDRNPLVFNSHLLEMLSSVSGAQIQADADNMKGNEDLQAISSYLNTVFIQELWNVQQRKKGAKTMVILEDYHEICGVEEIERTLRYIIDNMPRDCTLVISSRVGVGLLTVKQSMNVRLLEIGRDEMCFSEAELSAYIKDCCGIKADYRILHDIAGKTEGWAAGIAIICQNLKKSDAQKEVKFFNALAEDIIFKYFTAEIMKTLESELVQFLANVAILKDFTVEEASCITGVANAIEIIESCEKRGLFIEKKAEGNIIYRFHGLFREFLLQLHNHYFSGYETEQIILKAAKYNVDCKCYGRAIENYIACGHALDAVDLIMKDGGGMITFEAFEKLNMCFDLLPEDVVESNPTLLLIKTFIYQKGEDEIPALSKKALSQFKAEKNIYMQIRVYMQLAAFFQFRNDSRKAIKVLKQITLLSKLDESLPIKDFYLLPSLMREIWEEKYASAANTSNQINMLFMKDEWKWISLLYSCILNILTGDQNRANSIIDEVLELELVKKAEILKGFSLIYKSLVAYLQDERTNLAESGERLRRIGEKQGTAYMLAYVHWLSAMAHYRDHDKETAIEEMEACSVHFEQLGNQGMLGNAKLILCLWRSEMEHPGKLLVTAEKALYEIIFSKPAFNLEEIGRSLLGAIYIEAGDYANAKAHLQIAAEKCRNKNAKQVLCGILLQLSRMYFHSGDVFEGENTLRQAMQLASTYRYFTLWDMHMQTLLEACSRSIRMGVFKRHAEEWLDVLYGKEIADSFRTELEGVDDSNISDYCRYFISGISNSDNALEHKISVCLLGKFTIAVDGTEIESCTWKTKKIEGLFKYLVINRGRQISRDVLMELFWPESDRKSASMSFRAALYELRKVLVRFGVAIDGKDSILIDKNGALELIKSPLISVDIDEFMSLYSNLGSTSTDASAKIVNSGILEKMVRLYKGSFAEDFLLEDQVLFSREQYKSIFLEAAFTLAAQYIEQRRFEKAEDTFQKILDEDAFNERACLSLLSLYIETGRSNMAANFYSSFKSRMQVSLGIAPGSNLENLIAGL